MEKRLLLALALAMLVLWVFPRFLISPMPPEPPVAPGPELPVQEASQTPPETSEGAGEAVEETIVSPRPAEEVIQAGSAEELQIQTAVYAARLSSEGARLESLRLRDYEGSEGETLETIGPAPDSAAGWPLDLVTGDEPLDEWLRTALYVADVDGSRVRFEAAGEGFHAVKELRFDPERYTFQVEAGVWRDGEPVDFSLTWQRTFGDQSIDYDPRQVNVVHREDGGFARFAASSIGQIGWLQRLRGLGPPEAGLGPTAEIGVEDRYFLAMFLLPAAEPVEVGASSLAAEPDEGEDSAAGPQVANLSIRYPGEPASVYLGPKQADALAAVDPSLTSVINYGSLGFFSAYFLYGLLWIHDNVVANYGWSIILLTIVVNLVFFPLRIKQQLSMLKMQKLGPQMRSLQDKIKKLRPNDPRKQELQMEMMGLYKKHGVNPLGGCLPLLLQMPFLWAMFRVLQYSIEMRHASWALWIHDLSQPDPYVIVLPGLMGLSMFAMQKMTPTAADPSQARMMLIMPVLFPIMLIRMQSGLMLYWLTSNLVGIGQQYFIRKFWAPAAPAGSKKQAPGNDAAGIEGEGQAEPRALTEPENAGEPQDARKRGRRRRRK